MTVRFADDVEHGDIDGIVAALPPTAHEGGGREREVAAPSSASSATADSVAYPRASVHGDDHKDSLSMTSPVFTPIRMANVMP
jgi:hypothetical protein